MYSPKTDTIKHVFPACAGVILKNVRKPVHLDSFPRVCGVNPSLIYQLTGDFYTVGKILGHTLAGIGVSLGLFINFKAVTARCGRVA